ncbi:MAG: SpoIID/LytB domain-containing protein [Paludibacteraceae bacterium]
MDISVGILTAPKIEFEQREHTFLLKNVRIGIGFHWDRCEDQEFEGRLRILDNADGTQTAVNTLPLEDYLTSVISSEMSADSPLELLKAHAVISRSWAIRAIGHTSHVGYDVCADDHCQRYEGLRRRNTRAVQAVRETRGMVLTYGGEVCDCRYYKCCGGKTEVFSTCWDGNDLPYLRSVECPYCGQAVGNTRLQRLVLNNYDQETTDFHGWEVRYSNTELSRILREKTGMDFGDIPALKPLQRGASGRIYSIEIVGTRHTMVIGKELAIRQALSRTCLYSSWFEVEEIVRPSDSVPSEFVLRGHGWGHGVGLCQIGAAQMASLGFSHQEILAHYYPNSRLTTLTL